MKLSEFDYNLPDELIAQSPLEPRDHSRLLVINKNNRDISHHTFYEIINYLKSGDVLVVNNSKVFPARLFGKRADTGGSVEILLNKNISGSVWEAVGKNLKPSSDIVFNGTELKAAVLDKKGKVSRIDFNFAGDKFFSEIEKIGHTPLPPYIKKNDTNKDKVDYQTVYAKPVGSAAAPTAGLHFTRDLLNQLGEKGVEIVAVTLHVGLGTFAPVESENIEEHQIHSEYYSVTPDVIKKIIQAKKEKRRVIAVGTTSTRVLETIFDKCCHSDGLQQATEGSQKTETLRFDQDNMTISGWTKIFIYPGYKFKCIDGLITNFHLPKSSLLMLVSALAGKEKIDYAYAEAIKNKYRFFSYGDAMLIT